MSLNHTEIEEFFLHSLLEDPSRRATLAVRAATLQFRPAFATVAAYAFVNCAIGLEDGLFETTSDTQSICRSIYKATALFSADVWAAETILQRRVTCEDVIDIWRQTHDTVFAG